MDIDEAFDGHLVDIDLTWPSDADRLLCLTTDDGTRVGCLPGAGTIALPDMLLAPGRYLLTISGDGDLAANYELRVAPGAAVPPPATIPPGPDAATASPASGAFSVSGDLTGSTSGTGHVYAWTLSEADAARAWRLDLSATPAISGKLALFDAAGTTRLATGDLGQDGTAHLWDLRLSAGTYTVWVTQGGSESPAYVLQAVEETAADIDPEPDDLPTSALPLDPSTLAARGRVTHGLDVDRYTFDVDEAMAANSIAIDLGWTGSTRHALCLETDVGSQIQCREARDGISLSDLVLAPGRYLLAVSGNGDLGTRYDLAVSSGAPPSAEREAEPNDLADASTPWDPSIVMQAVALDGDVDSYRISIPPGEPQVWRLEAVGSGLGLPVWVQPDGTSVGKASVIDAGTRAVIDDLYLVQGDHLLTMRADGEYTLALTPMGVPDPLAEREPNDDFDHASPLEIGAPRTGRLPAADDVDGYRFSLSAPEHVVVTVDVPEDLAVALEVTAAGTVLASVPSPGYGQPTVFDGHLPHADYEVWLRPGPPTPGGVGEPAGSEGIYSVSLERADPFAAAAGEPAARALEATLALSSGTSQVAAFATDGQRVDATLTVTNPGDTAAELTLDAVASDDRWAVEPPASLSVPAGESVDAPVAVRVPADAALDAPVRVTVRARDGGVAQATGYTEITPVRDVAPVAPEPWWGIPVELLGGLDVASTALGAVSTTARTNEPELHDGVAIAGRGFAGSVQLGPDTVGVDLAGEQPIPIVGTIIDPLAVGGEFAYRPRSFTLLLSEDGSTYQEVLTGELGPQTVEQAFVLAEPVPARFAQLRVDSTWGPTPGQMNLGEWKVIAAPGSAPDTALDVNIADLGRGGHVVFVDPPWQDSFLQLLSESDPYLSDQALDGDPQTWIVGFLGDRAAQITRLEWLDQVGSVPENRFASVDVEVSAESPLGPWEPLGTWTLERAPDGSVAPLGLAEPVWARFVRLTAVGSADGSGFWELPGAVRVIERPTEEPYRSILAEWGQSSPRAIAELLQPPSGFTAASTSPDAGETADQAADLEADTAADGQVSRVSGDVDWYALTVPEGDNTLSIGLRLARARDVTPRLFDASGAEVELLPRGRNGAPPVDAWTAMVEPGDYRLELAQPVLSAVVAFDTSPSIYPWFPRLRAAVRTFADDVTPGQEAIQIIPFEESSLLADWSDQAYLIAGAMDAWSTTGGSSGLRASIVDASALLQERDGMRAILVLGDAVGGGFESVGGLPIADFERVRPAIFPVHVGGTDDPVVSTRIMQDLVSAGDGFYQYATSQAAMERAFDRMATWLRRPAVYELSYETSAVDYPPATLSVEPAEGASVRIGGISLELVLDTSGSMNKKLEGSTRMAAARAVLGRLVTETLPEGLPTALRTFKAGNGSCKTVMASPFAPLDRAAMDQVIADLPLHRKTRTPLGATLHAVGDDLAERPGPKIVVFVTDGKETCKGDPEAEVERLVELGIDVALNIVGFALEDEALKSDMESWAAAGGGVFFDAQDQDSLLAGIAAALQAPFRVYDSDSVLVRSGVVGGAGVDLPVGTYRVEVLSEPPVTFEAVAVAPGEGVRLEVPPPP